MDGAQPVTEGSPTWNYLTKERGLPAEIVTAATKADALRQGPYGSAWFAHRDGDNAVTGFEMRGPGFRSFSSGGDKTLFRLQLGQEAPIRLAVTEAPIDAMSLAVLEGMRKDTLYVAHRRRYGAGNDRGAGAGADGAGQRPGAVMIAATDADSAGEQYAAHLAELAAAANVPAQRAVPAEHKDWNDALRAAGQGPSQRAGLGSSPAVATIVRAMDRSDAAASQPWSPAPIALGQRVRAFEAQQARAAAPGPTARGADSVARAEICSRARGTAMKGVRQRTMTAPRAMQVIPTCGGSRKPARLPNSVYPAATRAESCLIESSDFEWLAARLPLRVVGRTGILSVTRQQQEGYVA